VRSTLKIVAKDLSETEMQVVFFGIHIVANIHY